MISKVDLKRQNYIFQDKEIKNLKCVNYIYGKNGTGKSSLVDAIEYEYGDKYNICKFDGFENLFGENEGLQAISLGNENKNTEKEIKKINKEIKEITNGVLGELKEDDNEYEDKIKKENRKLKTFYTQSASKLKQEHPRIFGVFYNINGFEKDVKEAKKAYESKENYINDKRFKNYKLILDDKVIDASKKPNFFILQESDLNNLKDDVNSILVASIKPQKIIKELQNNSKKEQFALEGMKIHKRQENEICAFCGNKITKERWELLDNYFSKAVDNLQKNIENKEKIINRYSKKVNKEVRFNTTMWHPELLEELSNIEKDINISRHETSIYLDKLLKKLEARKLNIFKSMKKVEDVLPKNYDENLNSINELWDKNIEINNNLKEMQKRAKKYIVNALVLNKISTFDYRNKIEEIKENKRKKDELEEKIKNKEKIISNLQNIKKDEINKTKNEIEAANDINKYISKLGDNSFKLQNIKRKGHTRGLYIILDQNGKQRKINTLSTGEKNILSFLLFMFKLKDVDIKDNRKKVIIFDDPVNSNDDNSQYLVIALIQDLMFEVSKNKDNQVILLTHNNYFYIQIRPTNPHYDMRGYYKLIKIDNKTKIKMIQKSSEDLKNIYEELWSDLYFSYKNNKINLMWNLMRRIIETYNNFYYSNDKPRELNDEIPNNDNKILYLSLLKSLNTNSHVGYETDIDLSNRNKCELLTAFKDVFINLNAKEHYDAYWNSCKEN